MTVDLPPVERVLAYTPKPGDTVVLKVPDDTTREQVLMLQEGVAGRFGEGVTVVILGGAEFVGVVGAASDPDRDPFEGRWTRG